jgi:hypothetical protein
MVCGIGENQHTGHPPLCDNEIKNRRAKELVSLVDASKFPRKRGVLVEDALDKIISTEKANIASEKPQPRGTVVSGCPVGKVRKTCVSSWNF